MAARVGVSFTSTIPAGAAGGAATSAAAAPARVNEVNDSIVALADSEPIGVARKLLTAVWPGVFCQGLNSLDDSHPHPVCPAD